MAAIFYQQVDILDLEQQIVALKEKHIHYFNEVEMTYPLKWNIEKDDKNYLKPYTTILKFFNLFFYPTPLGYIY